MLNEALFEPEVGAVAGESEEIERFALSARLKKLPQLAQQEEEQSWRALERCASHLLLACVESPAGLALLKCLLDGVPTDDEGEPLQEGHAEPVGKLNLAGLIDELETLFHLDPEGVPRRRRHRLKSRLMQWAPPHYQVVPVVSQAMLRWPEGAPPALMQRLLETYHCHRNRLMTSNLGLVHSIAARFRYLGLSYEDLVQEGCLGLLKAIEHFDWRKGYRFSTYAHRVISQSIHLAIDKQSALVRKPFRMLRDKALVDETRQKMEQKHGRAVQAAEVLAALPEDMPYRTLHGERVAAPTADAQTLYQHSPEVQDHALEDAEDHAPHTGIDAQRLLTRMQQLLPQREQLIIRMRFGIGLGKEHTFEEIGKALALSTERVRQLTRVSLERLQQGWLA